MISNSRSQFQLPWAAALVAHVTGSSHHVRDLGGVPGYLLWLWLLHCLGSEPVVDSTVSILSVSQMNFTKNFFKRNELLEKV